MKRDAGEKRSGGKTPDIADTIGRRASLAIGVSSIGFAVGFVGSVVVARLLGAEGKGEFSLFLVTVTGLTNFAGLGIDKGQMYHASRSEEKLKRFLPNGLVISIVLGGGAALLYFLLGHLTDLRIASMGRFGIIAGILLVPIVTMLKFQKQYLLMIHAFVLSRASRSLQQSMPLIAALALYPITELTVDRLIVAVAIGMMILLIVVNLIMRLRSPVPVRLSPGLFSFSFVRESLGFGLRTYFGDVLLFLAKRLDFFLVAWFLGKSALGIYSVAVALSEVALRIPRELGVLLFPVFAAGSLRRGQAASMLRKMNVIALGLVVGMGVLARPLTLVLFGTEFQQATEAFQWLLPGTIAWSTVQVTYNRVSAGGRPGLGVFVFGGAILIDIALNLVLLPRVGVIGAAMAATASYLFAAIVFLSLFCRSEGCSYREAVVPRWADVRSIVRTLWSLRKKRNRSFGSSAPLAESDTGEL